MPLVLDADNNTRIFNTDEKSTNSIDYPHKVKFGINNPQGRRLNMRYPVLNAKISLSCPDPDVNNIICTLNYEFHQTHKRITHRMHTYH